MRTLQHGYSKIIGRVASLIEKTRILKQKPNLHVKSSKTFVDDGWMNGWVDGWMDRREADRVKIKN